MELSSYHELAHHTNIYSLSSYEGHDSSGCIISTSRSLYQLSCLDNSVKLAKLHFAKLASTRHTDDTEVLGHAGQVWGNFFVTAVMCKHRSGLCALNVFIKEQSDRDGHTEHSIGIELTYNPFKVALVRGRQSEIGGELYTIVSGSDSRTHCER